MIKYKIMKALNYLLFAILASHCLSISKFCSEVKPTNAEDCHKASLNSDEGFNFQYCCYIYAKLTFNDKTENYQYCGPATKTMFNEFSKLYDIAKKTAEDLKITIHELDVNCDSKYLVNSILLMLLFLL